VVGAVLLWDDAEGDGCHADNEINSGLRRSFTRRDPARCKAPYEGKNAAVLAAASAHHSDRQYPDGRGHAHTVWVPLASAPLDIQRKRYQKLPDTVGEVSRSVAKPSVIGKTDLQSEGRIGLPGCHLREQTANSEFANGVLPLLIQSAAGAIAAYRYASRTRTAVRRQVASQPEAPPGSPAWDAYCSVTA
jgi:hypothetical protein